MELKRLLKRIEEHPEQPIIVNAEELTKLAEIVATEDFGNQKRFTEYLKYCQWFPYEIKGTESYYDLRKQKIVIGYTAKDIKDFIIRLAMVNKKFAYQLVETKSTEDYYQKICFIHEATHAFVDEAIHMFGENKANILECYLQYTAIKNPIDEKLFAERKDTIDPRILDLLDALCSNPLPIREDGYYTVRPHARLHEILANWAELVFCYPDMNKPQDEDLHTFINNDARVCLNRIFKLKSLTKEKQNEFKLP